VKILPIPGYEGVYLISEYGEVTSFKRACPKILKYRYDYSKYRRVSLNGKDKSISRLVALTFLDDYDENLEVNHIDGDIYNNHFSNLEMVTHKENMRHASKTGLLNPVKGEKNHLTKLTEDDVLKMRYLWFYENKGQSEIVNLFKCGRTNLSEIVRYKSWKHLP
jgi:hypothetical protein